MLMKGICEDCRHGLAVIDNVSGESRWLCVKFRRVLADVTLIECKSFELKVPQVPYIPRLDPRMVADLRFHMLQVENILKVLEREQIPPQRKGLV